MKPIYKFFASCTIVFSFGCASSYSQQEIGAFPENYEELWGQYLMRAARDPSSVQTSISKPTLTKEGWATCAVLNAKNGFGGYSGNKGWYVVYRRGAIVSAMEYPRCNR